MVDRHITFKTISKHCSGVSHHVCVTRHWLSVLTTAAEGRLHSNTSTLRQGVCTAWLGLSGDSQVAVLSSDFIQIAPALPHNAPLKTVCTSTWTLTHDANSPKDARHAIEDERQHCAAGVEQCQDDHGAHVDAQDTGALTAPVWQRPGHGVVLQEIVELRGDWDVPWQLVPLGAEGMQTSIDRWWRRWGMQTGRQAGRHAGQEAGTQVVQALVWRIDANRIGGHQAGDPEAYRHEGVIKVE